MNVYTPVDKQLNIDTWKHYEMNPISLWWPLFKILTLFQNEVYGGNTAVSWQPNCNYFIPIWLLVLPFLVIILLADH